MRSFFVLADDGEIAVYRTKWSAFLFIGLMTLGLLGFGIGFIALSSKAPAFAWFGGIFFLAGLWFLFLLPRAMSSVANKPGVLNWSATKDGIRICGAGMRLSTKGIEEGDFYPWSEVNKVVLASKWHTIDSGEKNYTWNKVLLFLKPERYTSDSLIERSRHQRANAPDGSIVVAASFPKGEAQSIKVELQQVCPSNVNVIATDKIQFDWRTRVVL